MLAVAALAALVLAGCTSTSAPAPDAGSTSTTTTGAGDGAPTAIADYNPQPREKLAQGGTLTTVTAELNPQFNRFHVQTDAETLVRWRWYNPVLALFDADGTYHANPDYLTDVKKDVVDGKSVVTYTINPKAHFNDGTPIDWRTFEATWKANSGKDPAFTVQATDGYSVIESVVAGADDRQVVVTFATAYPWVDSLFNSVLHPKAAADAKTFTTGYLNDPRPEWGAGPYTVRDVDLKANTMTFERNPEWWGDPGLLDERRFVAKDATAAINAFRNGEVDATGVGTADRLAQVKGMKDIDIRTGRMSANNLLMLNSAVPALADLDVRTAVFKGIDRATLAKITFQGMDYTEPLPGSLLLYDFQQGYADNLAEAGLDYDPAAAKKLLDEAGWKAGADGVREKAGAPLTITYATFGDDPLANAVDTATVSMLAEIGVQAKISNRPWSDFNEAMQNRDFGMIKYNISSANPYGYAYFCQLYCSSSQLNVSGTGTPEFDAEIQKVAAMTDAGELIAAGNAVETKIFREGAGMIPVTSGPLIVAAKAGLANASSGNGGSGAFFVGKPQDVGWEK